MVSLLALTGCGDDGPRRVAITGNVNLDGQPLKSGTITFIPTSGTPGSKTTVGIVNGVFELDEPHGLVVGMFLVEIWATKESGSSNPHESVQIEISPRRDRRPTLRCETTAQGPNRFTFELETEES